MTGANATPKGRSQSELKDLPHPKKLRWQPLRSGLVNLYRYDYEEFWYDDGHLLLRGNNGTGKSRVLALQLPFLLDGDVSSHRLEPDGDASKKIEWNLLLGNKYTDRLGYTWIEFGRIDDEGHEHFVTLGCGLHAAEHRGLVARWFFVTSQRIGRDLYLLTSQRIPLTKERLGDAIGSQGTLYTTAGEYRKAVDHALFRLGERYYPLVNLLVQLRQPQLSRHLDEKRLSNVLSEALPPLSENVIADVAESFRSLDDDQSALASLRAAGVGVENFLREYSQYLQIAAMRRAAAVRTAQTTYEKAREILSQARDTLSAAEGLLERKKTEIAELELDEKVREAELKTLLSSPEMQDAQMLERMQQQAADRKQDAEAAKTDTEKAITRRNDLAAHVKNGNRTCAEALNQVENCAAKAIACSSEVVIDTKLLFNVETAYRQQWNDADFQMSSAKQWEVAIQKRFQASQLLRSLNLQVETANNLLGQMLSEKTLAEGQVNTATERRSSVSETHRRETDLLIESFNVWSNSLVELQAATTDDLIDSVRDWCERADGPNPMRLTAETAFADATRHLSQSIETLERASLSELSAIAQLEQEQGALRNGSHTPPPTPHTRAPGIRDTNPGAPLWLLIDFIDGVPDDSRVGIEAALESAGFLDAWVLPDGRLINAHNDTVLVATPADSHGALCLDALLKPAIDHSDPRTATVDEILVQSILRSIPLGKGNGPIWVNTDGSWQAGPMHGSWTKVAPQHIGQSAREATRRKRLFEIDAELLQHQESLKRLRDDKAAIDSRQQTTDSELQRLPDDSSVRNAIAAIVQAVSELERARKQLAESEKRVTLQRVEYKTACVTRDGAADDLKLQRWVNDLTGFESRLHELRTALAGFWPSIQHYSGVRQNHERTETMLTEAQVEVDRRTESLNHALQVAAAAESEFKTLEASIGLSVQEILQRIEAAKIVVSTVSQQLKTAREKASDLRADAVGFGKDVLRLEGEFDAATATRNSACQKLENMATVRLMQIAVSDVPDAESPWSTTRAVDVARIVANRLQSVDVSDSAWTSSEKDIHQHIQVLIETLQPHGQRPSYAPEDGVLSVIVNVQGKEWTMADLRNDLENQIRDRQRILDTREIEILERHLIGEVSSHLHDLLHQALDLVQRMNAEIESRPMSTGMALRFKWEVDETAPGGLVEVRSLLLRKDGTWSTGDRLQLGKFLQQQIRSVREGYETGTWADHLKLALDYRTWHRFVVERQQDGKWQRLTRRTHGTGSGGEKAVALTVPQFAAAAAHYQSASPLAPRLILLDEAFVGIDNDMRSKCMGLLAAFDLDFIMTSEREWGCYPTLPGLAIYQLSARQGLEGIGITRWTWNGRQKVRDEKVAFDIMAAANTQA